MKVCKKLSAERKAQSKNPDKSRTGMVFTLSLSICAQLF
jgi:hypothetical protein